MEELSRLEIHYDDCKIGKKKEDSIDKVANATIASQIWSHDRNMDMEDHISIRVFHGKEPYWQRKDS